MNEDKSFIVDDLSKAEWALKKIKKIQSEIEIKKQEAVKMKADIDKWLLDESESLNSDIDYFLSLLQPFIAEQLKDSKKKSISLPSGKAGFKAGNKSFILAGQKVSNNQPELIKYIKENNPDFIQTTETVKWADYKKTLSVTDNGIVVTSDGEIIPDMKVTQEEDKFYINVK